MWKKYIFCDIFNMGIIHELRIRIYLNPNNSQVLSIKKYIILIHAIPIVTTTNCNLCYLSFISFNYVCRYLLCLALLLSLFITYCWDFQPKLCFKFKFANFRDFFDEKHDPCKYKLVVLRGELNNRLGEGLFSLKLFVKFKIVTYKSKLATTRIFQFFFGNICIKST